MFIRVLTYNPKDRTKVSTSLVNTKKISYIDEDVEKDSSLTDLTLQSVIFFGHDDHRLRSTESVYDLERKISEAKKRNIDNLLFD